MTTLNKQPFEYSGSQAFQSKLVEWVGDVLYDVIPDHGYEIRDEQIYTAFQIADAICGKKPHLAEAGLGTGKTFAYLLSAIPYARFKRKPVIIACATTALQEQLAAPEGDINKLASLLALEVDARMAKDPNQYVCDERAHDNKDRLGKRGEEIAEWLTHTKLGQRSEMPTLSDAEWNLIKWDESMNCETCVSRGYCKLVKAREAYRETKDLIIVDHETFFHDLWTRKERLERGQSTILPDYAAVIFDEGHRVLLPASMQAGQYVNKEELDMMVKELGDLQGARDSLVQITETLETLVENFFDDLDEATQEGEGAERLGIVRTPKLIQSLQALRGVLDSVLMEMQIEQELYTESLSLTQIQAFEAQIERALWALSQMMRNQGEEVITWVTPQKNTLWVVPRHIDKLLQEHLFKRQLPVIFTSATLSNKGDFDYFIRTLGLKSPTKSTIGSPFDLASQVTIELRDGCSREEELVKLLQANKGSALVLTHSLEEVKYNRQVLAKHVLPFEVFWEDQADRGYLVRQFKEDKSSVLVGANFWEGIDVPGEALTLLIIWDLPFSEVDPLIEVQRKEARAEGLDPVHAVDYPDMALKLKQGCGRLIRTEADRGTIVILDNVKDMPWEAYVLKALPEGAQIK